MDQKARAAVIDEFAKPSKTPQIMLISLKAGGVGLNLLVPASLVSQESMTDSSIFSNSQNYGES